MLNIFQQLFDSLFPARECLQELEHEDRVSFLRHYVPRRTTPGVCLSTYTNPKIKAAVTANKFYNSKKAAFLLSALLEQWLKTVPQTSIVFVPIPLSARRQRKRGYNQVTRIISCIEGQSLPIANLLKRTKDTTPQTSLSRKERLKNMTNAFTYQPQSLDESVAHIVIIDDVVTTGATMRAAYKTLLPHLPKKCKVTCLAIAH